MKGWNGIVRILLVGAFFCGCAVYTPKDIQSVEKLVSEASAAGARKKAPYEYYSAVEHLKIAKEELSEADDENAKVFGEKARAMAEKALLKSR
jgi:hypothetical protein